ncbi:hypothetical protein Gekk315_00065 [Aeromonas phage Gekk3-15]
MIPFYKIVELIVMVNFICTVIGVVVWGFKEKCLTLVELFWLSAGVILTFGLFVRMLISS